MSDTDTTDPLISPLDHAHAAVTADPANEALRLRFFERLADGEMYLLLAKEAEGGNIEPRIFDLEDGRFVLVFDLEERLAEFSGGVAPYAALPGRVVANMLKDQGIGLGVNLGVPTSQMLLPPEAMDWLAETLDERPIETEALPEEFHPPKGLPQSLLEGLNAKLARAGGLASGALLAAVTYRGGRRGHMLAFLDVADGAQGPLARAASEALVFSGIEAGEIDVTFLQGDGGAAKAMAKVALRFDLPEPPKEPAQIPGSAPGMDPEKPPRLI